MEGGNVGGTNSTTSDRFRLIDSKLKGKLGAQLLERRAQGDSWRDLEHWILESTGERVSFETVRNWHRELSKEGQVA